MKLIGLIAASFAMAATAAAQDAVPRLTGAWKGTGKILLYGTTEHLSGSTQNAVVRDLEVTHRVEGQDGRLIWGTTSSANNDSKEPFAWALSSDNKTIVGADTCANAKPHPEPVLKAVEELLDGIVTLLNQGRQRRQFFFFVQRCALVDFLVLKSRLDHAQCREAQFLFRLHCLDDVLLNFL